MADLKISQLTAISVLTPATDVLPVVDVGGVTKKITTNQILASGGVASLASATITGALTVDTSTLVVDATNDRVGMGTATPGSRLDVRFATNPAIDNAVPTNALRVFTSVAQAVDVGGQIGLGGLYNATDVQAFGNISGKKENSTSGNNAGYLVVGTCDSGGTMSERYRIDSTGISTWAVAGTTAMTLNSTGLGIGASPAQKLTVAGSAEITGGVVGQGALIGRDGSSGGANYGSNAGNTSLNAPASGTLRFNVNNGTFAGQFDTSGNLILSSVATPPTLTINGQLVANATSNTNLRFSYRGSDGTTRVANLTLA